MFWAHWSGVGRDRIHKFKNKNYKKLLCYSVNHAIIESKDRHGRYYQRSHDLPLAGSASYLPMQGAQGIGLSVVLKREVTLIMRYAPMPHIIAIVEVGEDYIDQLITIKTDRCSLEEALQIAREAGYQVIPELCAVVPTTHEVQITVAVEPE